jgi:hypothetical protein
MITSYRNDEGEIETISSESLEDMATALADVSYAGPHLRVCDERGSTRGWVGVDDGVAYWRAG